MFTVYIADQDSTDAAVEYDSYTTDAQMLDGVECLIQAMEGERVRECDKAHALAVIDADGTLVSADWYRVPGSDRLSMLAVLAVA